MLGFGSREHGGKRDGRGQVVAIEANRGSRKCVWEIFGWSDGRRSHGSGFKRRNSDEQNEVRESNKAVELGCAQIVEDA